MSKPVSEQMKQVAERYEKATGKKLGQKTNADHIRSMSDEELAKWLADMWDCCYCSEYDRTGGHPLFSAEPCDQKCEQHCFDWLKQPYKN